MLAEETPAHFVAFDLLALDDETLLDQPFQERRGCSRTTSPGRPTSRPLSREPGDAEPWLRGRRGRGRQGAGRAVSPGRAQGDGQDQAACARSTRSSSAGVPARRTGTVGSLILGLYDEDGELHVVGHSSGLRAKEKRELVGELAPYETGERGHGDASRWKSEKELEWIALRPELVVEVTFDHVSGGRIRHGTKMLRWREDKAPRECKLEQMK